MILWWLWQMVASAPEALLVNFTLTRNTVTQSWVFYSDSHPESLNLCISKHPGLKSISSRNFCGWSGNMEETESITVSERLCNAQDLSLWTTKSRTKTFSWLKGAKPALVSKSLWSPAQVLNQQEILQFWPHSHFTLYWPLCVCVHTHVWMCTYINITWTPIWLQVHPDYKIDLFSMYLLPPCPVLLPGLLRHLQHSLLWEPVGVGGLIFPIYAEES